TPRPGFGVRDAVVEPAERESFLRANAAFSLDLYARLRVREGNLVCSPLGVSVVLGMLAEGARGGTREEILAALRQELPPDRVGPAFQSVLADLAPGKKGWIRLSAVNGLWTARGLPFDPEFLRDLRTRFGARAEERDFEADPEGARRAINRWAERRTGGRIPDLFAPGDIHTLTAFVVADALHFEGKWATPFRKESTADLPFHLAGGGTVTVPTMRMDGPLAWYRGEGFQAVDLPYRGEEVSLTLLVPDEVDGLPALEESLTAEGLDEWIAGLRRERILLRLPRFTANSAFDLEDPLRALGMETAFVKEVADFSGAAGVPGEVFLQVMKQKALIAVDETGTSASAVTGGGAGATSAPPVVFADRPFLFLLRHRETGTLLFMGRVANPKLD
ncbi:MAG: serpin family protein, partial [Planctomycetaceae bacterium]|nr:serpin family protein [Planctomycetaceae bacterium]